MKKTKQEIEEELKLILKKYENHVNSVEIREQIKSELVSWFNSIDFYINEKGSV